MRIETLAIFGKGEPIDGEYQSKEWSPFVFDLNDVKIYNMSDEGYATITLGSYDYTITIGIEYEAFKELLPVEKVIISDKSNYEYKEQ